MENIDTIRNFKALENLAKRTDKVLLVTLKAASYPTLMCQVIESSIENHKQKVQCLTIEGEAAETIQKELNILNLPALVIFKNGRITSIFQGLIAQHELEQILSKIN